MTRNSILIDEDGYTLVETLVAMTLFVGVLIPMISVLGNFTLNKDASLLYGALFVAESEMTKISLEEDAASEDQKNSEGFLVTKNVERNGRLTKVTISVASTRQPEKKIVTLQKMLLSQ